MCDTTVKTRTVAKKLEYIRCRLFLMASLPDFDEMVRQKVHLYKEFDFNKEIAKRLDDSITNKKRYVKQLQRISEAKVKAFENKDDADFYEQLAKEIAEEIGADVNIMPGNLNKFNKVTCHFLF